MQPDIDFMKKALGFIFSLFVALHCVADSPLTSTFFAEAYKDVDVINEILLRRGKSDVFQFSMTEKHLNFFDNPTISLDQKIALVNALGWGTSQNIDVFKKHLQKKYTLEAIVLDSILQEPLTENQEFYLPAQVISYDDLTLLAYVQVMHDYFRPMLGMQCAYRAAINNQKSEATTYILALILAQYYLDFDWCLIYPAVSSVRDIGPYSKDFMRKEAVSAIFEYIEIYRNACDEIPLDTELTNNDSIFSAEHWIKNPVYIKPDHQQISDKKSRVDLKLLNKQSDENPMFNSWVVFDEASEGTTFLLQIQNDGNLPSIETNMLLRIDNSLELEGAMPMYFQHKIPVIQPSQTLDLRVTIPNYWIYDPNADFEILLDYDNNIIEENEKNNHSSFHEWG